MIIICRAAPSPNMQTATALYTVADKIMKNIHINLKIIKGNN